MTQLDPKKTIFVIDGSSFLYRAYYGTRPLHTSKGIPVQAVYSFCRMIKKLMNTFNPEFMAIVWDSKGPTTRHELYQDYKATRQAPPSDLFEQKKYIVQFADAIGLRQVHQQGLEADDIMYSIAKERAQEGDTIVLITSDKDMGQTLSDQIFMYDAFKDKLIDVPDFEKEKGFPVAKIPFYFALLGDLSDNIPGVKGIGKTGALQLVNTFNSLEDLYNNLDKVPSARTKTALQTHKDNAFLSLKLFLLQYHPTQLNKEDVSFNAANWNKAFTLFQELDFTSLLQERAASKTKTPAFSDPLQALSQYDFKTVRTWAELADVVALLQKSPGFALDTETTGPHVLLDELVGLSVCVEEGTAYYIPCGHKVIDQQLSRQEVLHTLKPVFESPTIKKYLHNAKFDELVLRNAGITLAGLGDDTLIAASLLLPEWQRLGLKTLSQHFFNETMLSFDDVVKAYKLADFSYVPLALATRYAAADAHQTLKLKKLFDAEFAKPENATVKALYNTIELPLENILLTMELQGVHLDAPVLQALDVTVSAKLLGLQQAITDLVGIDYANMNLNSPKQVQELLFEKLQLPPQKKSAKGLSYSTDQEVLSALSKLHPIPGLILQYRELAKLKSTYIDALPTYINPNTGNVHTTYSQTNVATGRLASYDPNLQNIPADTGGYGIEIRAAFKPQDGYLFLSADYSQIELRILA
ncbi:MAG TPA: DNA polymerase, partial [Candidatus Limnocylindria bacterium]|nr:DNA polymerase [Candidatus Limnocylindria bacterium]